MNNGGAEKSLISVLERLDTREYQVDLFAIEPTGFISEMIPEYVNIIYPSDKLMTFRLPLKKAIVKFLSRLDFLSIYNRIMYSRELRKYDNPNKAEQYAFRYFRNFFKDIFSDYDVAVSYVEKTTNYIVSELISAKVKIGYLHSDYEQMALDSKEELRLTRNLHYIVTVSENCARMLKEGLPELSDKVRVIENIIDKNQLIESAKKENPFNDEFSGIRVVTVGRISAEKGPDMAIEACEILMAKGYDLKWHWIGAPEDESFIYLAKEKQLVEKFIFEGVDINPYKFIYNADLYVQPSRFEGKCIAIEEAKALGIPVVSTGFTNAPTQIENKITGIISQDISSQSLAEAIEILINDKQLYANIRQNLLNYVSNENEIEKFESLIDKEDDFSEAD